ncbi:MAG: TlpA family protein disulfide reductase [Rhodobiaceae bacterium]|nr:TlpA family protein disulfide reductase [Rhodobiaceae bacterium]MCC0012330.1 TlpA family protein disulfide reductase [Rhodobiaceae bacterium]MCC0019104.1 TlpA family protein disulfide reductase [Rhodobiaceae bacterium]MCC0051952.1 TlpA family protein disulfide reductase [Rhodobiaceae bacterium]
MMGGGLITILALGAVIYAMTSGNGNLGEQNCATSAAKLAAVSDRATGEVAALLVPDKPTALPPLTFIRDDGAETTLADFKGRTVLLNLWATWCVPCRKEMPALDRLQSTLGGEGFEVVAVNVDTRNPEKARAFLEEVGVTELAYYADNSMKIFRDLKTVGRAFGMPTTVLIDESGCELGTMAGPAEWDSRDALELIRAAMGGGN